MAHATLQRASGAHIRLPEELIVETVASTHRVHLREHTPTELNDRVLIARDRKLEHARPAAIAEVVNERLNANARKQRQDPRVLIGILSWVSKKVYVVPFVPPPERQPVIRKSNRDR